MEKRLPDRLRGVWQGVAQQPGCRSCVDVEAAAAADLLLNPGYGIPSWVVGIFQRAFEQLEYRKA